MKEIVNRLQEQRNIELAKSILESHGYKVTKKLNESYSWYRNEDGYYMIKGYFDEDGSGSLPAISQERDGTFVAMLSGSDYRGKSFDDLESAKKYIELNVSPNSIARYATDDGPWNW